MFAEGVAAEKCCCVLLLIIYGVRLLLRSAFVFKSACRQDPFCSDMLSCGKYFCVLFWCLIEIQGAYEQIKLKTERTCSRLFFEELCRIVSEIHHQRFIPQCRTSASCRGHKRPLSFGRPIKSRR